MAKIVIFVKENRLRADSGPACCPVLYFFQLEYFLITVWVPDRSSILQLVAGQRVTT